MAVLRNRHLIMGIIQDKYAKSPFSLTSAISFTTEKFNPRPENC